ncbi:MAG: hypothetical protein IKV17_07070 [Bacteroidaceae bacterium]|nr:hypothetical protein [Bacteroidaceae bacterium]
MNSRKILYFPILLYVIALLSLWLLSWLLGVMQLLVDGTFVMGNLMTAEGIRWALRSSLNVVDSAPWGVAMLSVVTYATLAASGLLRLVGDIFSGRMLTANQRRAVAVAAIMLLLYLLLLFACTVAPWNFLLGASYNVALSPLARGWLLVLFVGVLLLSLSYGYVYGNFRSIIDALQRVEENVKMFIPAFLSMLPAVALLSCMRYMAVFELMNMSTTAVCATENIVYAFPFLFVLIVRTVIAYRASR